MMKSLHRPTLMRTVIHIIWICSVLWTQTCGEENAKNYLFRDFLRNYTHPFLASGSILAQDPPYHIIFIFSTFGISAVIRAILRTSNSHFPYTVLVLLMGGIAGWLSTEYEAVKQYTSFSTLEPKYILIAFLPTLIFKSAFSMDYHTFMKSFMQISIIAVPGFIFSTCFIGIIMKYTFNYNWSWEVSFLFGSIASTCYPQGVVLLLKELGQSKQLSILIEGEALLTNGAALVIFSILLGYITGFISNGLEMFVLFMKYTIGGPILGLIAGKITTLCLSYLFNDPTSNITLTLVSTYVTYYIGEEILGVSGVLSIVIMGVMVSAGKTSISSEVETFMHNFWDVLVFLSNTMVFMMAGVAIVEHTSLLIHAHDFIWTFITYLICNFTRCLMYLMLAPILSRIGYGLTWKNAAIAIWSGIRGAVSLCLSLIVLRTENMKDEGLQFIIHVTALVVLTLTINGTTILLFLRFLGMSNISLPKKVNMNNALRHLNCTRDRSIGMLKMDRFLADSNWIIVEEGTCIKHPYKIELKVDDDDDEEESGDDLYMGFRYTICPDCQKNVPNVPTAKEIRDMTKEAQLRILKAKKVSYWRQFEHGMLSKEAVRTLVGAVEIAEDKEIPVMEVDDLTAIWKQRGPLMFIRRKLLNMMTVTEDKFRLPPRQRWRKKYFKIAINKWFEIFICVAIALNAVPILLEILVNPPSYTPLNIGLKVLNNVFFIIYFAEFVIKNLGLGFVTYIKSHWNKLDFFIVITSTADLVMDYLDLLTDFDKASSSTSTITTASKLLRILRLLRLCRLLRTTIPKAIAILDTKVDVHLSQGYDIGKGFVTGEEEILKLLKHIVDNKVIHDQMKAKIEEDRLAVTKELGLLQRDQPWIAITVKTRQAIRSILNNMKDAISELKDGGLLDEVEYAKLKDVVEERLKYLRTHYQTIDPCPPHVLLKEVSWLIGDEDVYLFLLENAQLVNFNYGEKIIEEGAAPEGIYILVSGLIKLVYIPREEALKKLQNYGILPNADFITNIQYNEKQEDYIVSGNVIGELGVLTNRPYDVTMICDTSVQAYQVSIDIMHDAMNLSDDMNQGLRARMWRSIAIRIANIILMNVPAYQSWSQDKIKLRLDRAFVPTLTGCSTFVVNDLMEDVILIEGQFMDANSHVTYFAPCYVPRTVQKLIFPRSSIIRLSNVETKLLIIPALDVDEYELMEAADQTELLSYTSSKCLQHFIKSKQSLSRSKKKLRGRALNWNPYGFKTTRNKYSGDKMKIKSSLLLSKQSGSRIFPETFGHSSDKFELDLYNPSLIASKPEKNDDTKQETVEDKGKSSTDAVEPVDEKKLESENTEVQIYPLSPSSKPPDSTLNEANIIHPTNSIHMAGLKEEKDENNE